MVPAFFSTRPTSEAVVWSAIAAVFPLSLVTLILINISGSLRDRLDSVLSKVASFESYLRKKQREAAKNGDAQVEDGTDISAHVRSVSTLKKRFETNYRLERYRGSFAFVSAVYAFLFFFAFNKIAAISDFGTLQKILEQFPDQATAALLGAWAFALYSVIARISAADLSPEFLLRLAYQPIIAIGFALFVTFMFEQKFMFLISFGIGFLPYSQIVRQIRFRTQRRLSGATAGAPDGGKSNFGQSDLIEIDGIELDEIDRLHEENIMNIQQLAFSNPLEVHFSTAYPLKTIIDWTDQALLRLFVDKAQFAALKPVGIRGAIEMAQVLRRVKEFLRDEEKARKDGDNKAADKAAAAATALLAAVKSALQTEPNRPVNIDYLAYQLREDPQVELVYFLYDELATSS
jgi:hypothetical protein